MKLSDLKSYKVVGSVSPTSKPAPADNRDLIAKGADFAEKYLPGAQIGKALSNSLGGIVDSIKEGSFTPLLQAGDKNNANFGRIVGDTAQAVLAPASVAFGGPTGTGVGAALGRVGTNAALGAGIGASGALAEGKDAGEIATSAAIGGTFAGAASGAGEILNATIQKLPNRLLKQALPKLKPGNEDFALSSVKVGPISKALEQSDNAVSNLGKQVHTILEHPEYADDLGAGNFALQKTLNAFPDSEYTPDSVIKTIKGIVPSHAQLVDKVAQGTATLREKNTLRAAIDPAIKKVFTDAPEVSASKKIAAEFANALRGEVQSFAPETQAIFANLSKEIDLRNALKAARKKLDTKSALGLYDIVAALGGFTTAGPVGSAVAIGAEKAFRSPGVGIAAAKGLKASAKALPTVNALAKGLQAPTTKAVSKLR